MLQVPFSEYIKCIYFNKKLHGMLKDKKKIQSGWGKHLSGQHQIQQKFYYQMESKMPLVDMLRDLAIIEKQTKCKKTDNININ